MAGRNHVNDVANAPKRAARGAQQTELVDKIVRIGYFARGLVYGLIGYLAVQTVINGSGKITDQKGALSTIASQPFGKFVLILIAIGLVGLFLWGIIRAFADPMHKGSDAKGLVTRAGYLISGLSYGALFLPTISLIQNSGRSIPSTGQSAQNTAAGIMAKPFGATLIVLIGLVLIGVGLYRIYSGYQAKFNERFNSYKMNADERRWAVRLGRLGYIALGIVFLIIGGLAVYAGTTKNPSKIVGVDGALQFLAHQQYGILLLAIVAIGLIAFAIYSFMGAFWFRIRNL